MKRVIFSYGALLLSFLLIADVWRRAEGIDLTLRILLLGFVSGIALLRFYCQFNRQVTFTNGLCFAVSFFTTLSGAFVIIHTTGQIEILVKFAGCFLVGGLVALLLDYHENKSME